MPPEKGNNPYPLLKQLRDALAIVERQKISQKMLADKLGISEVYVSSLERGERPLTNDIVWQIEDMYGVDPRSLLSPSKAVLHGDATLDENLVFDLLDADQGPTERSIAHLANGITSYLREDGHAKKSEEAIEIFDGFISLHLPALMEAAKKKGKAAVLMSRLQYSAMEWMTKLGLEEDYSRAVDEAVLEQLQLKARKKKSPVAEIAKSYLSWRFGKQNNQK